MFNTRVCVCVCVCVALTTYTSDDVDSALALVKETTPTRDSMRSSRSITELDDLDRVLLGMEQASLAAHQEREKSLESIEDEELL